MDLPDDVRAACRRGLEQRAARQAGGTAAAVEFATRAAAGGPVTLEQAADAATAHRLLRQAEADGALGDPAINISRELWGGDAGADWAEAMVFPVAPLHAAASGEDTIPVVVALNAAAAEEGTVLARVRERLEAAADAALGRARAKAVSAVGRPTRALQAATGGLQHGPAILAAMAAAPDDAAALAELPDGVRRPLLAAMADVGAIRAVVAPSLAACRAIATQQQEAAQVAVAPALTADEAAALATAHGYAAQAAAAWLEETVVADLAALIAGGTSPLDGAEEGERSGRLPASTAVRFLDLAGGSPATGEGQTSAPNPGGEDLLCAGIALGRAVLDALVPAMASHPETFLPEAMLAATGFSLLQRAQRNVARLATRTVTTWRWSGISFTPHARIDGEEWRTERERAQVCRGDAGFPYTSTYYPGDHRGCGCRYDVRLEVRVLAAAAVAFEAVRRGLGRLAAPAAPAAAPVVYAEDAPVA